MGRTWTRLAATGVIVVAAAACGGSGRLPAGSVLGPGDQELSLRHDGRNRSYIVHAPPSVSEGRALPVVLAFHGGGGEPGGFKSYAGLDAVADREGFIVAYPFGSGVLPRRLLTWNAGECCGWAMNNGVDDVGFAMAIVDELARRTRIDEGRVYATGHSNGAMMAHRLGAARADRIAAVAPVAGTHALEAFAPSRPVAVLHIHSVDDPRALYEGGLGPPFPGTDYRSSHRPVAETLERWSRANDCGAEPRTSETRTGRAGTENAGQAATLLVWDGCSGGGSVAHWRLSGVGHGWPGTLAVASREDLIGPPTTLLDAAEEAWRFFARVRR